MSKLDIYFVLTIIILFLSISTFKQISVHRPINNTFYGSEQNKNITSFANKTEEEDDLNEELGGTILDLEGLLGKIHETKQNKVKNVTNTTNHYKSKKNHTLVNFTNSTNKTTISTHNETSKKNHTLVNFTNSTNKTTISSHNETSKKNLKTESHDNNISNVVVINTTKHIDSEIQKKQRSFISISTRLTQTNEIGRLQANYFAADNAGKKSDSLAEKPQSEPGKSIF